jgi:hypothetical protein
MKERSGENGNRIVELTPVARKSFPWRVFRIAQQIDLVSYDYEAVPSNPNGTKYAELYMLPTGTPISDYIETDNDSVDYRSLQEHLIINRCGIELHLLAQLRSRLADSAKAQDPDKVKPWSKREGRGPERYAGRNKDKASVDYIPYRVSPPKISQF